MAFIKNYQRGQTINHILLIIGKFTKLTEIKIYLGFNRT